MTDRITCVHVHALPLQILLRRNPAWRGQPTAVASHARPQAPIVAVNRAAHRARITVGMRCAAARALVPSLRVGVVAAEERADFCGELFLSLNDFSPRVEPCAELEGSFFLDPNGLAYLYGGLDAWTRALEQRLQGGRLVTSVITGFHRPRVHAIAQTHRGAWVLASPAHEATLVGPLRLSDLSLPPADCEALRALGVHTVLELLALERGALQDRFGASIGALHAALSTGDDVQISPTTPHAPIEYTHHFDHAVHDRHRLLFAVKSSLAPLLRELSGRSLALRRILLTLRQERAAPVQDTLEPSAPTLDLMQLMDLARLRLEALIIPSPVTDLHLRVEGIEAPRTQLELFRTQTRRDLDAGDRALARLRASFGSSVVCVARPRAAHLPEARVDFVPTTSLRFPSANTHAADDIAAPSVPHRARAQPPFVRRIFTRPIPLPGPHHADVPHIPSRHGAIVRRSGPWRINGAWWARAVERDYYYLETSTGAILWVYIDRVRRRWFLHGEVD